MTIKSARAPLGTGVVEHRQASPAEPWIRILGPVSGHAAVIDGNPPAGKVMYRIVYEAEDGAQGKPSEAVAGGIVALGETHS